MKKILTGLAFIIGFSIAGIIILISFYDFSSQTDKLAAMIQAKTGREFHIKGKTQLEVGLTPMLVLHDLSFANAAWSDTPQMITAERFEMALDLIALLKKKIIIKRLILKNSRLLIEKNQAGQTNYTFSAETQTGKNSENDSPLPIDILVNALIIENCQIHIKSPQGEKTPIRIKHLRAGTIDLASPVNLDIIAGYGSMNASITGSIGSLSKILQKTQIYPFKLKGTVNDSDLNVKGSLMNLSGQGLPGIKMSVRSNLIAADSFKNTEPDGKNHSTGKVKSGKIFSDQPFPFDFLNFVNLDADIKINRITAGQIEMHDVKTQLNMGKQGLFLNPFSASLFNGNLDGSLTISSKKNGLNVNSVLNIQQLDTQLFVRQLNLKKELKGQLNSAFNLQGQGNSMAGLMAGLNGHAWASMKDG